MTHAQLTPTDDILAPLDDRIWTINRPFTLMGIHLGHRMAVIQLTNGGLWIHSPVILAEEIRKNLAQLGPVEHLVAPSIFHDLYWPEYFTAYPQGYFYCAPGLEKKLPELKFNTVLSATPPAAWAGQIDQVILDGIPDINEVVFLHRSSGTLLVADSMFNMGPGTTFLTRLALALTGTRDKAAVSRIFRAHIKDATALRRSIDQILAWDFDRIIVGHGNILRSDGRLIFEKVYRFLK